LDLLYGRIARAAGSDESFDAEAFNDCECVEISVGQEQTLFGEFERDRVGRVAFNGECLDDEALEKAFSERQNSSFFQ